MSHSRKHVKDLTAIRFGRLLVVRLVAERTRDRGARWECLCDCGTIKVVAAHALKTAHAVSCGCYNREKGRTHGRSKTPEYRVWRSIFQRCFNPKCKGYPQYGGRGIAVCNRWRESFENFYADMGSRPSPQHSIDRVDNDGPYAPENCRWATRKEQMRNRRVNHLLTHDGKTMTIAEWSGSTGLPFNTITNRLQRGWSIADAITKPQGCRPVFLEHGGERLTISAWSKRTGIPPGTISKRVHKLGWPVPKALGFPTT